MVHSKQIATRVRSSKSFRRIEALRQWFVRWVTCSYLWRYWLVRYSAFHGPVGALNFSTAGMLYWMLGFDPYTSSTAGHVIHVYFGYFHDKDVTFRKPGVDPVKARIKYWILEAISYVSILLTFKIAHETYGVHENFARGVYAMGVGTAICLVGHRYWSFDKEVSKSE